MAVGRAGRGCLAAAARLQPALASQPAGIALPAELYGTPLPAPACLSCPCHCREFNERYKIDVKSQPRACHRLRMGCEKVRPRPAWPCRLLLAVSCSFPPFSSLSSLAFTPSYPFSLTHVCLPALPACPACLGPHSPVPALPHASACPVHSACLPALQMKKVLTTNAEAPINVECIMNDVDASGMITRDVFEEAAQSVAARLLAPVKKVGGWPRWLAVLAGCAC